MVIDSHNRDVCLKKTTNKTPTSYMFEFHFWFLMLTVRTLLQQNGLMRKLFTYDIFRSESAV